ncbi:hypothetical protein RRG08_006839 [Elysia crispata]|uniref:Uncharacterized protein n=1 Tax=Elysia crispata TaxID=231223 RepID=A0AAE0XVK4_9GAST|nr:hypothetical protein RRG08_006839 [Elysia crispata]
MSAGMGNRVNVQVLFPCGKVTSSNTKMIGEKGRSGKDGGRKDKKLQGLKEKNLYSSLWHGGTLGPWFTAETGANPEDLVDGVFRCAMASASTQKGFGLCVVLIVLVSVTRGQYNNYVPYYMYGANNYMSTGVNSGMWWVQPRCHWKVTGYRSPSLHQCGTFICPTMWYGNSQFACPPPAMFSNSLQKCVLPTALASKTRCQTTDG